MVTSQVTLKNKNKLLFLSFLYHTFFAAVYYVYSQLYGSDALGYFKLAQAHHEDISKLYGLGTKFIIFITTYLVQSFDLSLEALFFIYSLFGYLGLVLFYESVLENINVETSRKTVKFLSLILFIPGLNFWTSAIGKDSLVFFAISCIVYAMSRLEKRYLLAALALALIYMIRPHMFYAVVFAIIIAAILSKRQLNIKVIATVAILFVASFLAQERAYEYLKIEVEGVDTLVSYVESRANYNLGRDSSVDIAEYNIVFKVVTYLFRPLFVDAKNITMFVVSFENLLYLFAFMSLMKLANIKLFFKIANRYMIFLVCYFLIAVVPLASATANLGIAVRQKTMIIICLLALYVIIKGYRELQSYR